MDGWNRARDGAIGIAILFSTLAPAFVVGNATGSVTSFLALMFAGLIVAGIIVRGAWRK